MRVVVTGASGFVGKSLVNRLAADGHHVRALMRGEEHTSRGVEVIRGDLTAFDRPERLLDSIDVVFHLAGLTALERDPEVLRRVNVDATAWLSRESRRFGVSRFILLSTAKVHGEVSGEGAFREDDPVNPSDEYARSKLEGERLVRETLAGGPSSWTILRAPLVYGPGVGANFGALVRAVRSGIPLPFARVANRRSLVFVENLVDALCFVARAPGAEREVFLVSDGVDLSTGELVKRVALAAGCSARLVAAPPALVRGALTFIGRSGWGDRLTRSLAVDTSKIRRLGWVPPVNQDEAFARTLTRRESSGVGPA